MYAICVEVMYESLAEERTVGVSSTAPAKNSVEDVATPLSLSSPLLRRCDCLEVPNEGIDLEVNRVSRALSWTCNNINDATRTGGIRNKAGMGGVFPFLQHSFSIVRETLLHTAREVCHSTAEMSVPVVTQPAVVATVGTYICV